MYTDPKWIAAVFLWVFLVIFVATATLTLAALPGWIKVQPRYMKALVGALILQVAGTVVGFVKMYTAPHVNPGPKITPQTLEVNSPWSWDYAGQAWSTKAQFTQNGTSLEFNAATTAKGIPIYSWKSIGPVSVESDGTVIFDADQTIDSQIKSRLGPSAPNPGHRKVRFRLHPILAFTGTWNSEATTSEPAYSGRVEVLGSRAAHLLMASQGATP